MLELKGTKIDKLTPLHKVGDLVYFQGPLLSLYSDNNNALYLYDWAESDDEFNRWLVIKITLETLSKYIHKNLSHYDLIRKSNEIYSVDIDNNIMPHNIIQLSKIPTEYLPDKSVYHDNDECPNIKIIEEHIFKLLTTR